MVDMEGAIVVIFIGKGFSCMVSNDFKIVFLDAKNLTLASYFFLEIPSCFASFLSSLSTKFSTYWFNNYAAISLVLLNFSLACRFRLIMMKAIHH